MPKIKISILVNYGEELELEKSHLVLVHLNASIFVLLCNGTLCTAQAER